MQIMTKLKSSNTSIFYKFFFDIFFHTYKKAHERYQKLSKEEKEKKKQQYGYERYKNFSND